MFILRFTCNQTKNGFSLCKCRRVFIFNRTRKLINNRNPIAFLNQILNFSAVTRYFNSLKDSSELYYINRSLDKQHRWAFCIASIRS